MELNRRQFSAYALASLVLPAVTGCGTKDEKPGSMSVSGSEPMMSSDELQTLKTPEREFIYDVEITHNDIHDLEFSAEDIYKRVKWHHSEHGVIVACFKDAYQAAYDFHSHMHSPFEEDWARTREALDVLSPAYVRLDEATRDTELRDYYKTLDDWYHNLRLGVDPEYMG